MYPSNNYSRGSNNGSNPSNANANTNSFYDLFNDSNNGTNIKPNSDSGFGTNLGFRFRSSNVRSNGVRNESSNGMANGSSNGTTYESNNGLSNVERYDSHNEYTNGARYDVNNGSSNGVRYESNSGSSNIATHGANNKSTHGTIKQLVREKQYWRGLAHKAKKANDHHIQWGRKLKQSSEALQRKLTAGDRQIQQLTGRIQKLEYHHSNKIRDFNNCKQKCNALTFENNDLKSEIKLLTSTLKCKDAEIGRLKKQINILSGFDDVPVDCFSDDISF